MRSVTWLEDFVERKKEATKMISKLGKTKRKTGNGVRINRETSRPHSKTTYRLPDFESLRKMIKKGRVGIYRIGNTGF